MSYYNSAMSRLIGYRSRSLYFTKLWHKHITTLDEQMVVTCMSFKFITSDEEVHVFARVCLSVCLSVCLLARLLKNAFMDLDEMLRIDRCRDMDELINF